MNITKKQIIGGLIILCLIFMSNFYKPQNAKLYVGDLIITDTLQGALKTDRVISTDSTNQKNIRAEDLTFNFAYANAQDSIVNIPNAQQGCMYIKDNKFIWCFNFGPGGFAYYYIDFSLLDSNQLIKYSASEP